MNDPARPGLYVHLPFCATICPYCDATAVRGDLEGRRRFLDHLLREVGMLEDDRTFDTIYLGGGTPSLLPRSDLERLFEAIRSRFRFSTHSSIALEANPEDVSRPALRAWIELGVDTVLLGVQSFSTSRLRRLGRGHDGATALRASELCLAAGLRSVSLELVYGDPGQSRRSWSRDLDRVVELGPQHVSCYELGSSPAQASAELFRLTHERLGAAGWGAYEVCHFARSPQQISRHNRKYWEHLPYLGLGPGAHSFSGSRRAWNTKQLPLYEERIDRGERPIEGWEELAPRQLALESLMFGLRQPSGVDLDTIRKRWGVDLWSGNIALIDRLVAERLIDVRQRRLLPRLSGLQVADGLAGRFELG